MNKILILIIALFYATTELRAQEKEPFYMEVKWKVGDLKTVTQIDSNIVYQEDTLFMSTIAESKYSIKIVSENEDTYEVLLTQSDFANNLDMASEAFDIGTIEYWMTELVKAVQAKFKNYQLALIVEKTTGLATEVINEETQKQMVKSLVDIFYDTYMRLPESERDLSATKVEIQMEIQDMLDEQMEAAMQSMLNNFNYIFQGYNTPYVLGEKFTTDVSIYEVNELKYGDEETPGKMHISSEQSGSILTIAYTYDYDKQAIYEKTVVEQCKADMVPIEEFNIDERVISEFDTKTSWLRKSSSYISVRLGTVDVYSSTQLIIK